jgi:hypothetical protein
VRTRGRTVCDGQREDGESVTKEDPKSVTAVQRPDVNLMILSSRDDKVRRGDGDREDATAMLKIGEEMIAGDVVPHTERAVPGCGDDLWMVAFRDGDLCDMSGVAL